MARILIVDDEANLRRLLAAILREGGDEVVEAPGVTVARQALESSLFDLVITDQKMPDGTGLDLIQACHTADPNLPIVLLTAFATLELAVEAMRLGAFDVIAKPFEAEAVQAVVRRATERTELLRENERLRRNLGRFAVSEELVGTSPPMRQLRELIARVAPTHATVLITGETGTGKELVARALHAGSPRSGRSFVAVNCAAFPDSLLESELFGHERGAFTGADRTRQGLFEAAHRGTLFLDEAGEMSLPLQAKLLRVLMNGEIVRLGSAAPRTVDVRIVVATHRDLRQRMQEGLFREDLYYRLAVVPIEVPPLRARSEDLPLLAARLSLQLARELKMPPRPLDDEALAKLRRYPFPGNVRELRNLIERATILARGARIGADDLPALALAPTGEESGAGAGDPVAELIDHLPESLDLRALLLRVEEGLIARALKSAGGVQAEAARRLGLSRSDLGYKLRHTVRNPTSR